MSIKTEEFPQTVNYRIKFFSTGYRLHFGILVHYSMYSKVTILRYAGLALHISTKRKELSLDINVKMTISVISTGANISFLHSNTIVSP